MKTKLISFCMLLAVALTSILSPTRAAHAGVLWKESIVQPPELQAPQRGSLAGSLAERRWTAGEVGRGSFDLPFPMPLGSSCAALPVDVWPSYAPERGLSAWGQGWAQRLEVARHRAVGSVAYDDSDDFQSPWGLLVAGDDGLYYTKGFSGGVVARMEKDGWRAWSPTGDVFFFSSEEALQGPRGIAVWFLTHVTSSDGVSVDLSYQQSPMSVPILSSVAWGLGSSRCARLTFRHHPLEKPIRRYVAGIRADLDRRIDEVRLFVSPHEGRETLGMSLELQHAFSAEGTAFFLASVAKRFPSGALGPPTSYTYAHWKDFVATTQVEDNVALNDFAASRSRQHGGSLSSQHVTLFDVDNDGAIDIETSDDFTTYFLRGGRYVPSPQRRAENPHYSCQIKPGSYNAPRPLARMFGHGSEPEVVRLLMNDIASTTLRVCRRDGSLVAETILPGCWVSGANTRLVDLDRDGRADLIRVGPGQVLTSQNLSKDGNVAYGPRREQKISPSIDPDASWFHDFNGDGIADLISLSDTGIWVWYGLGNLDFDPEGHHFSLEIDRSTYTRADSDDLFFLDANHDGMMDLLVVRQGRYPSLFINTGSAFQHFPLPQLEVFAHGAHGLTVADLSGSGASELSFTLDQRPSRLRLDSPETSLLTGVSDGFGNSWQLTYARGRGRPGSGVQPALVEKIVARTSGQAQTTQCFAYQGPRRDSHTQAFLGFEQVSAVAEGQREELTYQFFEDHAPQVARQTVADLLRQSPARHTRTSWAPSTFRGQSFAQAQSQGEGWQDDRGQLLGGRTRRFATYAHPGCVSREVRETPWGELVSDQTLADLPAWGPALHCAFSRHTLTGKHPDSALDFSYSVSRAYDPRGKVSAVVLDGGDVVQALDYDELGRMTAAQTCGSGRTELTYEGLTHHIRSALLPDGVKLEVGARSETTGAPTAITRLRGGPGWTQHYAFDQELRLSAITDDFRSQPGGEPLVRYDYRRPAENFPGVVETSHIWDTKRRRHEATLSDGAGRTVGTAHRLEGRWILPSLSRFDPAQGVEQTHRLMRPFLDAPPQGHTFAQLSASAAAEPTSWLNYDGVGNLSEAGRQLSDEGVVERLTWRQAADAQGGITVESFAGHAGQVTRRDGSGLVTSITDEEDNTTKASYDAAGRLRTLTFADGTTHRVTYDLSGRQSSSCRDNIGCIEYSYDGASSLTSEMVYLDRDGRKARSLSQKHDHAGRIVVKIFRDHTETKGDSKNTFAFFYDGMRPDGKVVAGQIGHVTGVRGPGFQKAWSYYPDGSLRDFELSIDGWRQFRETLSYWADGKLKGAERQLIDLADGHEIVRQAIVHRRDDDGRASDIQVNGKTALLYFYDPEGRASGVGLPDGSSLLITREEVSDMWSASDLQIPSASHTLSVTWDERGNVAKETLTNESEARERRLSYDARNYLAAVNSPDQHFYYDAVGRRQGPADASRPELRRDRQNRIIHWQGKRFSYGSDGRLDQVTLPNAGVCRYVADEEQNRLWHSEPDGKRWAHAGSTLFGDQTILDRVTIDGRTVALVENGDIRLTMTDAQSTPFIEGENGLAWAPPFGGASSSSLLDLSGQPSSCGETLVTMGKRDLLPELGEFLTPDLLFLQNPSLSLTHPKESNLLSFGKNSPLKYTDRGGELAGVAPVVAGGPSPLMKLIGQLPGPSCQEIYLRRLAKKNVFKPTFVFSRL